MCLQKYESYLLSVRSFSPRDFLLKQLMGVKITYGIDQTFKLERLENWTPTWSPNDAHLLCSLICGYRLLDVMALVHGCNTPAPAVPRTLLQGDEQAFVVSSFLALVVLNLFFLFALGYATSVRLAWLAVEISKNFHSFGIQNSKLIKHIRTYAQADASPFDQCRKVGC